MCIRDRYKQDEKLKTACGSPCYAAPEMIAGKNYDGLKVDIWSSGVVLFALLCGYLPFEDPNTSHLYKKILNGSYTIPKFLSEEAKGMLRGILTVDPAKRFTIDDIRRHPWFALSPAKAKQGIVVGVHQVPSEPSILKQIESYGFSTEYTQKCIEANKHNSATTTYYLLLQRFIRAGGKSVADLSSPLFEPITIGKNLKNLREALQLAAPKSFPRKIAPSPNRNPAEFDSRSRMHVERAESKKLEGTGGSSSKGNEVFQCKEVPRNSLRIGSPKGRECNRQRRKTPVACSENVGNLLGSRMREYLVDVSVGNCEERKRNVKEKLNTTAPLKGKLRLSSKEERALNSKQLSTRAQAMFAVRPKRSLFEVSWGANASVTPSAGVREVAQFSPKCNNMFVFTGTHRSSSKFGNAKTPKVSRYIS
eukprot:TRINITY_DN1341_c0_g1_i23.p1 TRINITY_DN1341_c0_g1~~TRINITY_DN1341_c0_g1_i23.p1  ORF type:complete len:421 (+),score=84.19 TRINITY_DN1341_c0_g1_i23:73-1335(+)